MAEMPRWDIFCSVIDNYGDIGVCWRLSCQLATEYGIPVRLWVDDIASLHRICPAIDPGLSIQHWRKVEVRRWIEPFPATVPAEVIIEAFGCTLPAVYVTAMSQYASSTQAKNPLVWINLEYLSAEPWVERYHRLPSPHPHLPLIKYFFFPGFTTATGGLIREQNLLMRRTAWQQDFTNFWKQLGLPLPNPTETTISLFCYDSPPIGNLLDTWAASRTPVRCLLPESKLLTKVTHWSGREKLIPGDAIQRGNLSLHILPFLSQENYDYLLWACDCNFVRGEDSFVRAQWAAKPFIWQIYPQQSNAHQIKLDAFLDRYCQQLTANAAAILHAFHLGWNHGEPVDWSALWQYQATLQTHAVTWARQMTEITDLAYNLVQFSKDQTSHTHRT
ncbi:MAG: elongation factor P maturation arginine rhamnosyltransferase EarP [Nitrosomonas sp.]|nr:elongation factor P maturation arginine rhamnosyltransferase EarP [Nitrosomonas sp.]